MPTLPEGSPLPPPPAPPTGAPLLPPWALPPTWASGARPARPRVALGGSLLVIGSVLLAIGAFLPWFTTLRREFSGFTSTDGESDGPFFLTLAIALAGFGITLLAVRRVLTVAILAVVFGALALLAALVDLDDVQQLSDRGIAELGPGLPVAAAGSAIALAGGIVALSKRRR